MCIFTNETLNKFSTIFENKQDTYKLYYNIIPRLKWQKIQYIKKKKREEESEVNLALIAKNKNISIRELRQYLNE
jgi:hypothetical protein